MAFVLLALLPALAISGSTSLVGFLSGYDQAIRQLNSVAVLKEAAINNWLDSLLLGLSVERTTQATSLRCLLTTVPGSQESQAVRWRLEEHCTQAIRLERRFEELFLLDLGGRVVLSTRASTVGEYRGLQPYFQMGLRGPAVCVQTLAFSSTSEGLNSVVAVCPVSDPARGTIGVLAGRASLATLNGIMRENAGLGESVEAYIVGANHVLLTEVPWPGYAPGRNYLRSEGIDAALKGTQNGFHSYLNYQGNAVLGVFRWLPGLQVALLAEQSRSEALHPMFSTLVINLCLAVVAVMVAALLSILVARRLAQPIVGLARTAARISAGELDLVAQVDRQDEIGDLAASFNSMTSQLRGLIAGLEQRVQELDATSQALGESESRYRRLFDASPIPLWEEDFSKVKRRLDELRDSGVTDLRAFFSSHPEEVAHCAGLVQILDVNRATLRMVQAKDKAELEAGLPRVFVKASLDVFREEILALAEGNTRFESECVHGTLEGNEVMAALYLVVAPGFEASLGRVLVSLLDLTERKRAEAERVRWEEQLVKSQRMETLGVLAGGIAHDFNNLLTPILGYADLLRRKVPEEDAQSRILAHIVRATERARDLTQQLLAFGRRQVIELTVVDLGEVLRGFEGILRGTLREDIRLEIRIAPSLGLVRADRGQVEQVVANLSINSQDAMENGGTLTIELVDIDLDESFTARHAEVKPGPYVRLSVTDTGTGIDEQTIKRMFDPFFTTKKCRGTGLGLSTVYGIVKQHGGVIWVYSERNVGTTFQIHLPRVDAKGTALVIAPRSSGHVERGSESILVVEDNDVVRAFACEMLGELGYRVTDTESPERAIALFSENPKGFDLLLTDVIMPGLNGPQLYQALSAIRPDLKVVYMSGYTGSVLGHHGVLSEGTTLIHKPFSVYTLSMGVRKALEACRET